MFPTLFIAFGLTSVAAYFAVRTYVAEANARHDGESLESWLSRQRDPSTAGLVALLLGLPGIAFVLFSMHRFPRALAMTTAFAIGSAVTLAAFAIAVGLMQGAVDSVGHHSLDLGAVAALFER